MGGSYIFFGILGFGKNGGFIWDNVVEFCSGKMDINSSYFF